MDGIVFFCILCTLNPRVLFYKKKGSVLNVIEVGNFRQEILCRSAKLSCSTAINCHKYVISEKNYLVNRCINRYVLQ